MALLRKFLSGLFLFSPVIEFSETYREALVSSRHAHNVAWLWFPDFPWSYRPLKFSIDNSGLFLFNYLVEFNKTFWEALVSSTNEHIIVVSPSICLSIALLSGLFFCNYLMEFNETLFNETISLQSLDGI